MIELTTELSTIRRVSDIMRDAMAQIDSLGIDADSNILHYVYKGLQKLDQRCEDVLEVYDDGRA